jgi:hypothetical protein
VLLFRLTTEAIHRFKEVTKAIIRVVARMVIVSLPLSYIFCRLTVPFFVDAKRKRSPNLNTRLSNLQPRDVTLRCLLLEHVVIGGRCLLSTISENPLERLFLKPLFRNVSLWSRSPSKELVDQHLSTNAVVVCGFPVPSCRLDDLFRDCLDASLLPRARI